GVARAGLHDRRRAAAPHAGGPAGRARAGGRGRRGATRDRRGDGAGARLGRGADRAGAEGLARAGRRRGDRRTVITLKVPGRILEIEPGRPLLMGIVNASPESFSDGGMTGDVNAQARLAHEQIEAGAHLIDVGGESGVTDKPAVSAEEERRRVVPLVERLDADGVLVSVDTFKPEVARAALDAGAAMINDVSGLLDPELADVCAAAGAALVLMHTRARPKEKTFPAYDGPVTDDVLAFLRERMRIAADRGVG